ncbi:hypothetical protein HYS00_01330 [Candidatus Microgenomates bacterium]|nr:hypothetical protein [Candidatus Microgenomates bacterium]
MLFATLRRIFPGEELTMNYLIDPSFGERNYFVCHCGSPVCNGTQYIHPNKIVQFEKMFAESASRQSDEEKHLPFGATLPPLKTYPTHFTDDPFYDLFGSSSHAPTILPHDTTVPSLHALRKLLRESGTHLAFSAIKITVCGIMDDLIISTSI